MYELERYDKVHVGDSLIYMPHDNRMFWFQVERVDQEAFMVGSILNRPRWYNSVFLKCPGDIPSVYIIKEVYGGV